MHISGLVSSSKFTLKYVLYTYAHHPTIIHGLYMVPLRSNKKGYLIIKHTHTLTNHVSFRTTEIQATGSRVRQAADGCTEYLITEKCVHVHSCMAQTCHHHHICIRENTYVPENSDVQFASKVKVKTTSQ